MKEPTLQPTIIKSTETAWKDHPRFPGIQMKGLITKEENPYASISVVLVPPDGEVSWHMHATQIETVYLLRGQAVLTIGTIESPMISGCIVAIPAGVKHALRNGGSDFVELLAIFTPPNS